ncbi:MAG: nuclear transport factor 2 family protein [Pseudomonadota bacterium]
MHEDLTQITAAVDHYFQGLYHHDLARLKKAFHPQAQVIGRFKGRLFFSSLDGFLQLLEKTPAPVATGEKFDMSLEAVDLAGDAAVAKVRDLYQGLRFTDYLSLVKTKDEWVIVNKTYHHEPGE